MNWTNLWLRLFGTTTLMGIDLGFWVSMGISAIVAFSMIIGFWCTTPYDKRKAKKKEEGLKKEE